MSISELSERSTLAGGILASVPTVSVLAMVWLYADTGDSLRVAQLAANVFWLVIPSLALFLVLPLLIRSGLAFAPSLTISIGATTLCYYAMISFLGRLGIHLSH